MRSPGKSALTFIFFTVLVNVIGIGVVVPVMPRLIMDVSGADLAQAAQWSGLLTLVYAGIQLIAGPIIGNLSDRFGRRPILIISLSAYAADFILMAAAPNLVWLFVTRAVAGVFAATYATAAACIADLSPPDKRAQNFGLIGAAFGLGFIVGPVIGGLLGEIDVRAPFFAAAALAALNALYGAAALPESLPRERRRAFSLRRANPVGALIALSKRGDALAVLLVVFVFSLAHWSLPGTWAYFTQLRFGWSELDIGLSLGFIGLCSAIVMGGLARVVIPRVGLVRAAAIGLSIAGLQYAAYSFVAHGWQLYAVAAAGALAGLAMPALQGLMSNAVGDDQQGELQGALTSVQSVAAALGPLLMTQVFHHFNAADADPAIPGAAFIVAAGLAAVGLAIFATTARARSTASLSARS